MELTNKSLLESIAKGMYMYTIPQPREITSIHDIYLSKDEKSFSLGCFTNRLCTFMPT